MGNEVSRVDIIRSMRLRIWGGNVSDAGAVSIVDCGGSGSCPGEGNWLEASKLAVDGSLCAEDLSSGARTSFSGSDEFGSS